MSKHFSSGLNNASISLPPERIHQLISDGMTVVTATHRLSREYRQQYDITQLESGNTVWDTGDILPLSSWLNRCWQRIRVHDPNPATLIDDLQITHIWERIIQNDINQYAVDEEPLWNVSATTKAAVDTWKLAMNWDIDLRTCETSFQPDHQSFSRWANQFKLACQKNNWLDPASLIDRILTVLTNETNQNTNQDTHFSSEHFLLERQIAFIGFDRITPQQQRFLDHLNQTSSDSSTNDIESRAILVSSVIEEPKEQTETLEYLDEYEEWLAASHWARQKLEQNPNQRIAIVVPDLNQCREKLDHALNQVLSPNQLVQGLATQNRPYHLSLGQPIDQYSIIKAAGTLLRIMVSQVLPYEVFAKLLYSPFLIGASSELFQRSRLEMWTRRQLPFECTLNQFIETIQRADDSLQCPLLAEALIGLQLLIPELKPVQTFLFWETSFKKGLEQVGWPGEATLNSDEFQTVEAFFGHLKALTTIDFVGTHITAKKALKILERRLAEQTFQPETKNTSLEVMGVLEATGIRFDAMWFGGLTEKSWPPPLRSSPFIPRAQQEAVGFHQSSIVLNDEFARIVQRRLQNDCHDIIFSRPCHEQDVVIQPSPLFPIQHILDSKHQRPLSLIQRMHDCESNLPLEVVQEHSGLPISQHQFKGGTSVIQDQSLCPWRAYSRHRLGARNDAPNEQGLDAMDRGSIIHGALELIWQTTRSLANLRAMSDEERYQLVNHSVHLASQRFAFISGCGPKFLIAQGKWLRRILNNWLAVELDRSENFKILELEKTQTLHLGSLELRFKIDRIDQLGDGSLVLIDYKTGNPTSLSQWMGERPESPQLPLYAIAQMEPIEAVAFAHVNSGNNGYYGVSHQNEFQHSPTKEEKMGSATPPKIGKMSRLENHRTLSKKAVGWEEMLSEWYENLTAIAEQFSNGDAKLDPVNALACTRCDLHSFCRISEHLQGQQASASPGGLKESQNKS
ncbi:MAG: hypothetical protein GKR96_03025 [Gammaproteobacteria bacterium]|nr:hypothetical protein [Gammaproteobacteria bacterium]